MKTKLFLDFDNYYEKKKPSDSGLVVLNSSYNNIWSTNIYRYIQEHNKAYHEFEKYTSSLNQINQNLDSKKIYLYSYFFFPLSLWLESIDKLLAENKITLHSEIIFSSFSNNRKAFIFEAEGEVNRQFLYKGSYFLTSYIEDFLIFRGFKFIRKNKNRSVQSFISFYTRGLIFLNSKFFLILISKIFFQRREFGMNIKDKTIKNIILTRGIIQTNFIKGSYSSKPHKFFTLVSESSISPKKNFRLSRDIFKSMFYVEGYLSIKELIMEYLFTLQSYYYPERPIKANFYNVEINLSHILKETYIKDFFLKTYVFSIKRALEHIEKKRVMKIDKILCFDSLSPYSYYLKKILGRNIIQIQTTEIFARKYPKFNFADTYYFTNIFAYKAHLKVNNHLNTNFKLLNNIQYVNTNLKRKKQKNTFENITYFSQPIYYSEELELIKFLKSYCAKYSKIFRIKIHPRAIKNRYNEYKDFIVPENINALSEIQQTDLVITRNSSVGYDAWISNTPIVFFLNNSLSENGISFIPEDYPGLIKENISLEMLNQILPEIIKEFYNHSFQKYLNSVDDSVIDSMLD